MKNEPAVTVGTITAVVTALIALFAAFGLSLSDAQTTAIVGIIAVVAPIVAALFTRARVTPSGD